MFKENFGYKIEYMHLVVRVILLINSENSEIRYLNPELLKLFMLTPLYINEKQRDILSLA